MPRGDAQLCGDLVESQSESAQTMRGHDAIQAPVAVWMRAELIDERELAITPCSGFVQHAFDERP